MNFSIESYLDELRPLVNVDCGTYTVEGIQFVADTLEKKYHEMSGWTTKQVDCGKAGVGVEVRNKPESDSIDIMFIGHMDTVFPVGTAAQRPMSVDNMKAYGPGVSDMKSGLLNLVYAFRHIEKEVLDSLSICVCMNPDEETGSLYSSDWLQSVAKCSKAVLVAEAARADGGLVKARKGMARYKLSYHGKAAHAGNEPEKGRSAISEMAHWILAINNLNNVESGTTVNVGVVSGGDGANIVPDKAEAIVDVRFWSNSEYDSLNKALIRLSNQSFIDGVATELVREAYKPSMVPTEKTLPLMKLVEEAAQEQNIDINWKEVGGGSDANVTAILGVPTLDGFGPIGAGFHSDEEYLLLDSVEPRILMLISIIRKLSKTNL